MTKRIAAHLAKVKARYELWERVRAARVARWSVGRRWFTFGFLPTLVIGCGGTVFGVPVAWALRQTLEASRGAPSPDAAANEYLMALSYNTEEGLLPMLGNKHQDDLLSEWRAYRKAMDDADPAPSRLDFGPLTVGSVTGHNAEVTAEVSATWWGTDGRALSYRSEGHTWRSQTHEDNGWQVVKVEPPAWCGGYVRLDACRG
jgi:hypothetical protein